MPSHSSHSVSVNNHHYYNNCLKHQLLQLITLLWIIILSSNWGNVHQRMRKHTQKNHWLIWEKEHKYPDHKSLTWLGWFPFQVWRPVSWQPKQKGEPICNCFPRTGPKISSTSFTETRHDVVNISTVGSGLVCWSCRKKEPQTGWFKQQKLIWNLFSHSSGG